MNHRQKAMSTQERKKQLIAQGALFRNHIIESRQVVQTHLHPGIIVKGAIEQVVKNVIPFKGITGANIDFQRFLPLLFSVGSFLSKKSLLKPVLRGSLAIGSIAMLSALGVSIFQKRKSKEHASN